MLSALAHDPLKALHVGCALLTISFFVVRGAWRFAESPRLQQRWVRIAPHVIDTVFLLSGLALAARLHQYPFTDGWLTAKVFGLVAYIVAGTLALKGRTAPLRASAFAAALLIFGYIVGVARTRSPASWLLLLRG